MASTLDWSLESEPAAADLAVLADAVTAHGRALARSDAEAIACFIRDSGRIVGGACGRTEFSRLFVNYLWVHETQRRQGLASDLLLRLEATARERGCADALLDTLSDETAAWYGRRGWRSVALVPRYVGGFNRHVLVKPLHGASTVRVTLERADQPDVMALKVLT